MKHYENQPNSDLDLAPAAFDTFDACFNPTVDPRPTGKGEKQ